MKKIVIVGAGASGVYLSILLKQKLRTDIDVIILEQNTVPLKKLLATGNGRCNLSNKYIDINCYQSDCYEYVENIISKFNMQERMNDLGLYCQYQGNLLYPKSEQAASVKLVLMNEAIRLGVVFICDQEVLHIEKSHHYCIRTQQQSYHADFVVFAMGSEAGKLSGISQSRYQMLKDLKLNVIKPMPSLVQFTTSPVMKQWKGIRIKGTFSLLKDHQCIHKEKGELLFTDYGVSGIAVMQLSSFYEENTDLEIAIDFFDEFDEKKLAEYIELRANKGYNHFYDGLLHQKISAYFEKKNYRSALEIAHSLKDFRLKITGTRTFETAQVMKGGLSLLEVDQDLHIRKYPGMYAVGEILNVAGLCGGYNLHFAFACASHVADAIEREFHVKNK